MPIAAMGTLLKKATTTIMGITSISGVELSADTIDTTTLDTTGNSGYRTFIGSFKDAGEVSASGYLDKSHATIITDFESGSASAYTITFPDGSAWGFSAIVTGFSTGADLEDLVSAEITLKISGKPTFTAAT
jgi:predicted secreted protein